MTMRIGVLINEFASLGPRQSTTMLAQEFHLEGHDLRVFTVSDLGIDSQGEVHARVRRAGQACEVSSFIEELSHSPGEVVALTTFDLILCRTNPARDDRLGLQFSALQLLELVAHQGVVVLNEPAGLARAASKAYLGLLPAFAHPLTITSGDREMLRRFVVELDGPAVLKPAHGTRGLGVFRAEPSERNLNQILDLLLERGMVTAQQYVPRADKGDTRVLVVGGEILRVDGEVAAVRRVPGHDDFRSNIHAGGRPVPGEVTAAMERVVAAVGPQLVHDGLFLVGLDFIGDVVCEANVHSPGGLMDIERFTGAPFTQKIAQRLIAEAARLRASRAAPASEGSGSARRPSHIPRPGEHPSKQRGGAYGPLPRVDPASTLIDEPTRMPTPGWSHRSTKGCTALVDFPRTTSRSGHEQVAFERAISEGSVDLDDPLGRGPPSDGA